MLIRHLLLPDGNTMLFPGGQVVGPDVCVGDMTWNEFTGDGIKPNGYHTSQPYYGCRTRGNLVMNTHLENLAEAYENRQDQ